MSKVYGFGLEWLDLNGEEWYIKQFILPYVKDGSTAYLDRKTLGGLVSVEGFKPRYFLRVLNFLRYSGLLNIESGSTGKHFHLCPLLKFVGTEKSFHKAVREYDKEVRKDSKVSLVAYEYILNLYTEKYPLEAEKFLL